MSPRPNANPQQLLASHPEKHIWVAASAGSGKTKVLTDRVLRLLLQRTPPSQILCITYTKAAANEMQTRIHDTLGRWVMLEHDALKQELEAMSGTTPTQSTLLFARSLFARLLEDTPGLRIQTIHAFCQSILARFPLEAGVPPHFQILDERSQQELLQEAQSWLLHHGLNDTDEQISTALTHALHMLSLELGEMKFQDVIAAIIHHRTSIEQMLNQFPIDNCAQLGHSQLLDMYYQRLGLDTSFASEESIIQHYFCLDETKRQTIRAAAEAFAQHGTAAEQTHTSLLYSIAHARLFDEQMIDAYAGFFLTTEGEPRSTSRFPTKKVKENAAWILDWIARETQRILDYRRDMGAFQTASLSYHMTILAHALFQRYRLLKRMRGWLDYEDIIMHARDLLCSQQMIPWVLFKLDEGISHILVDEAQDTSPQQWELIGAIASEFFAGAGAHEQTRTLFVVGDEKQSIYRFQGADVASFTRMREQLKQLVQHAAQELHIVRLAMSFRSCPAILEAVDAIFAHPHAIQGLGDGSNEPIQHQAFRATSKGLVELWPVIRTEKIHKDDFFPIADSYSDTQDSTLQLAQRIASTVADWLHNQRILHAKNRPVSAGDILILVRRRNRLVNCISRELKRRGVPVAGLDRMVLNSHIAIKDLLALGQFLLLPEDDLTLATVLRSALYGVQEETLFELCYARGNDSVWTRVKAYTGTDSAVHMAATELGELLGRVDFGTPYDLYAELLYARGGRTRLIARMGEEVADPISVFLGETMRYEQLHAPSLQGFLHWISCGESMVKRDLEQGIDAVRIMTVHGSKGLQAPIVILPDTTSTPQNTTPHIMVDTPHDGALPFAYMMPTTANDCPLTRSMREANKTAETEEYHRLFYVALTRAEDELYLCGNEGGKSAPQHCWYHLAREAMLHANLMQSIPAGQAYPNWKIQEGDILRLSHLPEQDLPPTTAVHTLASTGITVPTWLTTTAPHEPTPPRPLAPSRLFEHTPAGIVPQIRTNNLASSSAMMRGTLIHKLLHILSSIAESARASFASHYVATHTPQWTEAERHGVIAEVLQVLHHPAFAPVFGEGSMAEVPLAGTIWENTVISGQVDRLVITQQEVLVVDFKSGTPPEHGRVPEAYLKQMQAYRALLSAIYPDRTIRCALIYTANAQLVEIEFL
jgi:ATP-dependent helicase/nuclease subunit A